MNQNLRKICSIAAFSLLIFSCKKQTAVEETQAIPEATLNQIAAMGFSNENVIRHEEGFLVEGDIVLRPEDLGRNLQENFLRVGTEEQYRTTNLVKSLPRTIGVSISNKLPSSYVAALDEALRRFNAEGLKITFVRVSNSAQITLTKANGSYLASAGFPTASGAPYSSVQVNSRAIGTGTSSQWINYAATIIAHELGHCIGFRHTDYSDRSYSCGGSTANEGASSVGAVLIPGTPAGPDPNSWMLACIGSGVNRPFNSNDRTALSALYK